MLARISHRVLVGLAIPILLRLAGPGEAAAQSVSQYDVKAAYLYNFLKFVRWPDAALPKEGEPLCVGVLGDDPFQSELSSILANKTAQGRPLVVRRSTNPQDFTRCQMVFVGASADTAAALELFAGMPILTVGDSPNFPKQGGILGFHIVEDRVRFDVNIKAAENAHLTLSSELLKVAHSVRGVPVSSNP